MADTTDEQRLAQLLCTEKPSSPCSYHRARAKMLLPALRELFLCDCKTVDGGHPGDCSMFKTGSKAW